MRDIGDELTPNQLQSPELGDISQDDHAEIAAVPLDRNCRRFNRAARTRVVDRNGRRAHPGKRRSHMVEQIMVANHDRKSQSDPRVFLVAENFASHRVFGDDDFRAINHENAFAKMLENHLQPAAGVLALGVQHPHAIAHHA